MQKLQRYVVLLLATLMLLALLAACTNDTPTEQTTDTATDAPEQTAEGETEPDVQPTVQRVPDERELSAAEYSVLNIVGTDDFGRVILPVDGKVNSDRYVGMFYFLTLGQHANHTGIYDINKITFDSTYHKAFTAFDTFITPVGSAPFWGAKT